MTDYAYYLLAFASVCITVQSGITLFITILLCRCLKTAKYLSDRCDTEIARNRIAEIKADPTKLIHNDQISWAAEDIY